MGEEENKVQRECLEYLNANGHYAVRTNNVPVKGRKTVTPGLPDICGTTKHGLSLFVECKTKEGKPTAEQIKFIGEISRRGGVALVARSTDDLISAGL